MSVTVDLFPTEFIDESGETGLWTNPANILDADADLAVAKGSGTIATLRLLTFNARAIIPEGAVITGVEAVYKAGTTGKVEGNPITGVLVKTGTEEVTEELFGEAWQERGGEEVPATPTEVVVDLSAFAWDINKLDDGAPIYLDIRCRNNGGKTTEFQWQYACLRVTYTPPAPRSWFRSHTDPMVTADPTDTWGEWGNSATSLERFEVFSTGGDPRPYMDGSPSTGHCRKLNLHKGDRAAGDDSHVERIELGANERRYGQNGGDGTFILYPEGVKRRSEVSYLLDPKFPISNVNWQLLMQMKQAQPYAEGGDGYTSPIIALQARQGELQIITPDHNEEAPLWSCPLDPTKEAHVKVVMEVFYSSKPGKGWIRLRVDARPGATDNQFSGHELCYDSGELHPKVTLTHALFDQEGYNWKLETGESIPSHLRVGIYRNYLIGEESGGTWIKVSGIAVDTWVEDDSRVAVTQEYPPDKLTVLVRDPATGALGGRWAEDEPVENVLSGLTKSGEMPGGHKEMSGALARDPRVSWPDLDIYSDIEVQGPGGEEVWSGRLAKKPATDGDHLLIEPAAGGYSTALEDDMAVVGPGFIDGDMTKWGEPSAARKSSKLTEAEKINIDAQVQLLPAGTPTPGEAEPFARVPAISHAWTEFDNNSGAELSTAESWYDSGGIPLGALLLDFLAVKGLGGWVDQVKASENGVELLEELHNFAGSSDSNVEMEVAAGRFFLLLRDYYPSAWAAITNSEAQWRNIKVRGRDGLVLQGTWPEVGFTARQMLPIVAAIAGLRTTDESLEDDGFIISQAWFAEPGPMSQVVTELTKYGQFDWFIFGGKLLQYRRPGTYGRKWQAYAGPSGLKATGEDGTRLWDQLTVKWQDVDGSTKTAGPPGSGAMFEDPSLVITDPDSPAVKANLKRKDLLSLNGICVAREAIRTGARFLEELQQIDHSGEAVLSGYIQDDKGIFRPASQVQPGDELRFPDAADASYRRLTAVNYSHDSKSASVTIAAPPEGIIALQERFSAKLQTLGLS